jgi:hypothetical protein
LLAARQNPSRRASFGFRANSFFRRRSKPHKPRRRLA